MVEGSDLRKGDVSDKQTERSFKEQRVRDITLIYYMRQDVKKALFEFAKDREVVPRYYEGFGKRPDSFQYDGDILEHVRRGATSFHCSEELWRDPLEINTGMSAEELNDLREGWDLLLDIDSPYLEYSKIYAKLIVESLRFHGIENFSVKFSGSKGFHIIVPWKAFPEEIYGRKTKDMFPEWARVICEYLGESVKVRLSDEIFKDESLKSLAEKTGKSEEDLIIDECLSCHRPAIKKYLVTWVCEGCKRLGEVERLEINKRIPKCPECRRELIEKSRKEIYFCEFCNIRSDKNPEMFAKTREKTEILIDADLVLVAPRHLFRMPYSLHEKTALASVVIDKDKIMDFQISDAKPFKISVKDYFPISVKGEARELLLQALDWKEQQSRKERVIEEKRGGAFRSENSVKRDYQKVVIENPSDEIFPPQILGLLKGVKQDGRKRALFILLSFFKSLGANDDWIEKKIFEWNEKNYMPLKKGYIISQLSWYRRSASRLPPNFSNPIYRELGVDGVDDLVRVTKNPVSYAVKRYFWAGRR